MSKFKWSGVLEEHGDVCLVLTWNWEKNEYKIAVEKQRHGRVADVFVKFIPKYFLFEDLEDLNEKPEKTFKEIYGT